VLPLSVVTEGPPKPYFRATARFQANASATVTLLSTSQTVSASVRNVGLGGLCIEVEDAIQPGQDAIVQLATPWLWEPLRLQGSVVWSRGDAFPALLGIRFHHSSHTTVQTLFDLLERSRD
jgi:hypothetical protein